MFLPEFVLEDLDAFANLVAADEAAGDVLNLGVGDLHVLDAVLLLELLEDLVAAVLLDDLPQVADE